MAHLNGIGIENFRVFGDITRFDLKPITILTGPNSSGKSSFNKLLLLLHENFSKSKIFKELDFTSRLHHLGNFKNVLSNPKNEKLTIQFPFDFWNKFISDSDKWLIEISFVNRNEIKDNGDLSEIRIFEQKTNQTLFALKFSNEKVLEYEVLQLPPHKSFKVIPMVNLRLILKKLTDPDYEIEQNGKIGRAQRVVPKKPCDTCGPRSFDRLIKDFENKEKISLGKSNEAFVALDLPYVEKLRLIEYYSELSEIETRKMVEKAEEKAIDALSNGICNFENDIDFLRYWSRFETFGKHRGNNYPGGNNENPDSFSPVVRDHYFPVYELENLFDSILFFETIFNEVVYYLVKRKISKQIFPAHETYDNDTTTPYDEIRAKFVPKDILTIEKELSYLLDELFSYLHDCFRKERFYYLPSMRSATARTFTRTTNLSLFEETMKEYYELEHGFNKIEKSFLKYWLRRFSIADDLIIERIENTVSVAYLKRGDKRINIADLGFGTTQLLPILMKIVVIARQNIKDEDRPEEILYHNSICIIEEPESNLHPNFESLLADMLVDAAHRFSIQFIIETHSEYLIRKMQYLTAKGKVNTGASVIYYFNAENEKGKEKVKKIEIREDGRLTSEFGPGFYDESTRLMMSMFTDENDN